jgi:hypothetical protein
MLWLLALLLQPCRGATLGAVRHDTRLRAPRRALIVKGDEGPDPYVGPLVNSYARSQGVNGGLVLKPPKVSDGGGNLDFSFKPGQEGASFDDKSWSWQKGEAPPPASAPAAAAGEPIEPATAFCAELEAAGKAKYPDTLIQCKGHSHYGDGLFPAQDSACMCDTWTLACPFTTCPIKSAWSDCVDDTAKGLGFDTVSQQTISLKASYQHHVPHMSTCTYSRPKPPHAGLPPVDTSSITWPTAVGKVKVGGISPGDCYKLTETAEGVDKVKKALVEALGSDKLNVLLVMCGSFEADFEGPVEDVKKAEEAASKDDFCFKVDDAEFCKPPLPATK